MSKTEYRPAFPQADAGNLFIKDARGMSLREWYAGQALKGFLSGHGQNAILAMDNAEATAKMCFEVADAMLEGGERK